MPLGAFKAALMGTAGVSTADVVLLSSTTASDDASVSITSGINSTYGEYIFKFYSINPATDDAHFGFQVSTDGGSSYGVAITSTAFAALHEEDDGSDFFYATGEDLANGTGYQRIMNEMSNAADSGGAATLHLFNPASTTYVKYFYSQGNFYVGSNANSHQIVGGYINTTTAIDDIQFKMSSGNINAGTIKMYGIK